MSAFVISLGGSLIVPAVDQIDIQFLGAFCGLITKYVRLGNKFAIITGGGKLARAWQGALRQLKKWDTSKFCGAKLEASLFLRDLDWVGIRATQLNAELVRAMFGKLAYPQVVSNPAEKVASFKILIGAGYEPGSSTDYDAVARAKTLGIKTVVNLSNVPYIYDRDPCKFKNAKPIERMSWPDYLKMVGKKWNPGLNLPFDPLASKIASRAKMRVVFLEGKDLNNLEKFLSNKAFRGTVIK
ncbi:MAG: hypothetical protein UX98_C0015G0015 [Parcubacteria group bacterium GW2011_GWA2_47_26]|nr:MAG: hypothetical protein UX98_C0015G0015 [Parcubacteria group bacterium GW2011_GWA2_47_26]